MASESQFSTLRKWLEESGGSINPKVSLEWDEKSGVHCRAASALPPQSTICTIPHSLALSSLNALVDDDFIVFRGRGLAPEAIGYFYLMHQYINKDKSFWKPYLDTLPGPENAHHTPFWFADEDLAWLEDTDVLHTTKARQEIHQGHYRQGLGMLTKAKVDTEPYSWLVRFLRGKYCSF